MRLSNRFVIFVLHISIFGTQSRVASPSLISHSSTKYPPSSPNYHQPELPKTTTTETSTTPIHTTAHPTATMATRFPSIEEFDDGQTSPVQGGTTALDLGLDVDPQADFLSREQAALGADADLFATDTDNIIGTGDHGFDASFPSLDVGNAVVIPRHPRLPSQLTGAQQVGPGGTVTGTAEPYLPGAQNTNAYTGISHQEEEEEPEVVK